MRLSNILWAAVGAFGAYYYLRSRRTAMPSGPPSAAGRHDVVTDSRVPPPWMNPDKYPGLFQPPPSGVVIPPPPSGIASLLAKQIASGDSGNTWKVTDPLQQPFVVPTSHPAIQGVRTTQGWSSNWLNSRQGWER
jgi:hypothetical protein